MSLHAISTLHKRSPQRVGAFTLVLSAMLALWLAISGQVALAQGTPPPPNATPQSATTNEDTTVSINTGIAYDNRYQIIILAPGPAHGMFAQNPLVDAPIPPGGTTFKIDYTPGANRTDSVSFVYQMCTIAAPLVCAQSATVTVGITPVNDGPQAGADNVTTTYAQSLLINVKANDNGGVNEGDTVSLVAGSVTNPTFVAGFANPNGNGTAVIEGEQIRYTAPALPPGACPGAQRVTFTYQVMDNSNGQVATGTVIVTINCAQTPVISLSAPKEAGNHKFKVDIILTSPNVNVAAVDFDLDLGANACLIEPDVPTDNKLADDVTKNPALSNVEFYKEDTGPKKVRIVAAAILPPQIIAGPGATSPVVLATVELRANGPCADQTADLTATSFTGTDGTGITGNVQDNITAPMPTTAQLNKAPTDISLSNLTVNEFNTPPVASAFVGKLSTTDADTGDDFTYGVVVLGPPAAPAPPGPATFSMNPNPNFKDELNINGPALSGSYHIRVTVTDKFGQSFMKTFVITVLDVNKAPKANDDGNPLSNPPGALITASGPTTITVLANDTDNDDFPADPTCVGCVVLSAANGSKGVVINQGKSVRYIPTDPKYTGEDVFTYVMSDNDAPNALSAQAKVTVTVAAEVYPVGHPLAGTPVKLGDCNRSGTVEAGDLTATGLEIFDGDGNLWYDIYKGSRTAFSARGCNANQDNVLDSGDISCTARKIFNANATCGAVMAAGAGKATMEVASGLRGAAGAVVNVPVNLRNNGNAVDTASFALAFDASKLSFDAADAAAVSVSDGQLAMVNYNAEAGRVEIVVTGMTATDGATATIRLTVKQDADGAAALSLADSSLGSEGGSLTVDTADGSVQIGTATFRLLLPVIRQ